MIMQANLRRLHVTFIHEKVPEFYAYFFMNQLVRTTEDKIQDYILK